MMKKLYITKRITTVVSLLTITFSAQAQDYHLAQYDAAPLYLNPALTGWSSDLIGDYRISTDFRSQWKSLGMKSFKTFYGGYDMPFEYDKRRYGVGAYVVNHRGGAAGFNTFNFMLTGAYDITTSSVKNPHILKAGVQLGLINKSYIQSSYTYGSQYDNTTGDIDPNIVSGEDFQKNNKLNFDAGLGIYYKYANESEKYHPSAGLALYHITMPNESFTSQKSKLPIRYVFHTDCKFDIDEKWTVTPKILYMNQRRAHEFNIGAQGGYKIDDNMGVTLGAYYRFKDAFVADIGFRFSNNILRFGYDFNTSYLKTFTGGRGGFEISLVMVGEKGKPLVPIKSFF